ncbi:MAG: RDD family protein [Thermoleophilia bacterium]
MTASASHDPTAVGGRRMLAALIDLALFIPAGWLVFRLMAERVDADGCSSYNDAANNLCVGIQGDTYVVAGGKGWLYLGIIVLLWLAYHGVVQAVGGTAGKLLLGLRVVDRSGSRATLPQCLLRSVTLGVAWLVTGVGFAVAALVGAILVLSSRDHRRVGDRLAKTYVVRTADVGRPPVRADGSGPGGFSDGVPPPPATDH